MRERDRLTDRGGERRGREEWREREEDEEREGRLRERRGTESVRGEGHSAKEEQTQRPGDE